MPEELPPDNVTLCRDLLRKNPSVTKKEVKEALSLSSEAIAGEVMKQARALEAKLVSDLAKEDTAASAVPPSEQKLYLKDPETGISHKLEVVGESAKAVVFKLQDQELKITK